MFDLHCHSHFSDGLLSPEALLNKALAASLQMLALTDHDTIAGLEDLRRAAKAHAIHIIDGVELSVHWKKYDIHVIGLNIEPEQAGFLACLTKQRESRMNRARQIAQRLEQQGVQDAYQKACGVAGHEHIGRPHFAQVLIDEAKVLDMQQAFKRYLGRGRIAYVPTTWLTLDEAINGILNAGGEAVLAHPLKYGLTRTKLHELIKAFKAAGGTGMEVVSGAAAEWQVKELALLCKRFDLLASTGSDYHGDSLSRVGLGQQQALPLNCLPIWSQWNL